MEERLKIIENMVYKLEHLNDAKDREVDAVRQTVRDFLRVFNNDVSHLDCVKEITVFVYAAHIFWYFATCTYRNLLSFH